MENFSEDDTNQFYSASRDKLYRAVWDEAGVLHWGILPKNVNIDSITPKMFAVAMEKLNLFILKNGKLNSAKKALELGCGNGMTTIWMASHSNAGIVGIDLSPCRIRNAKKKLATCPAISKKVTFKVASIEKIPFADNIFDCVYSQSSLYHVHHKKNALKEIYRVIKKNGYFVFDDLLKPKKSISALAKKYVYDRLVFDTPFNFKSYQKSLTDIGFEIIKAEDLSDSLWGNYKYLAKRAEYLSVEKQDKFSKIAKAFLMTAKSIELGELGWGLFVVRKR